MSSGSQRAKDLYRTLAHKGFRRDRTHTGAHRYEGKLIAAGRKVAVAIEFGDLEFTRLPKLTLLNPHNEAAQVVAHLEASGVLCFARNEDLVLDRYNVGGTALMCLELARRGLERALTLTHKRLQEEIAQEFPSTGLEQDSTTTFGDREMGAPSFTMCPEIFHPRWSSSATLLAR